MRGKIIVVKLRLLMAELKRVVAQSMIALTPGFTDLPLERLGYRNSRRPMFPLDKDFECLRFNRKRRAIRKGEE